MPKALTPIEVGQELERRSEAERSLKSFCGYRMEDFKTYGYVDKIVEALEALESGDINRLMINMPPQHGKTLLASENFPAWCLGRNPQWSVIGCAYNFDRATDYGAAVKDIVDSPEFLAVFEGLKLRPDSQAKDRWNINKGSRKLGGYFAAGVGTALTGRGMNLGIIDDPLKDREEADSKLARDRVWRWYQSVFRTRLAPDGRVLIIQTRWHDDDLSARLLEQNPDTWEVISIPAKALDDDALGRVPDAYLSSIKSRYPLEYYEELEAELPPREWSALYQQNPVPDSGDFFKDEWIRYYDTRPENVKVYITCDFAVSEGKGDYTVFTVFGIDPDDNIYVLDIYRSQTSSLEWATAFLTMVRRWKPTKTYFENGQIIKGVGPFLLEQARKKKVFFAYETVSPTKDKATRARSIQGRVQMGTLYFPQNSWARSFVEEMLRFPHGTHDDMVDTLSLLGSALDKLGKAAHPKAVEGPRGLTWDDMEKRMDKASAGMPETRAFYVGMN